MVKVLQKGENTALNTLYPQLNEIIIAIKWLKKPNDNTEFDIDSSAFLLTEQNKTRTNADFIFYNQPIAANNAVILKNNLFKINLNNVTKDINKISFVLTLHDAKQKQQSFGLLNNITIELFNFSDKQKLISYCVTDINTETEIILVTLYRYNAEWKFRAMGQGYASGLTFLAKNFGVDIEKPSEPIINTPPVTQVKPSATIKDNPEPLKKVTHDNTNTPSVENGTPEKKPNPSSKKTKNKPTKKTSNLDIHNTDMMTKQNHYEPIVQWFQQKNCQTEVNESATDTSGFFDEVAVELGDNYELLKIVSDTIKRRQINRYDKAYIDVSRQNVQNIEIIKKFCKQLYNYAFVVRYLYDNNTKKIILNLQSAIKIVNFFNGEWLEWYAVMKIANLCHQKKIKFSCIRNMIVYPANEHQYEIDVFFLINDVPLFIECKSGEYRQFIDKYSKLRKKLSIEKPYFLMLTLGVDNEHIKGLNAMFDITFVNETMLIDHIVENFLKKKPVAQAKPKIEPPAVKLPTIKNTHTKSWEFTKHSKPPKVKNNSYVFQKIVLVCVFLLVGYLVYYK